MNHLLIIPIILPLFVGCILLLGARFTVRTKRFLSMACISALLLVAIYLCWFSDQGQLQYYVLGNWLAPFGILLMLDRLSALMLITTAVLSFFALFYSMFGDDEQGKNFHVLFQFQLVGINGAFLTADLFNLFVFFEVLLIASYSLLLYGGGISRIRASIHYVVLNLLGSAVFLIALGLIYGILGTLNMADIAIKVLKLQPDQAALIGASGMLLLIVFGLKSACFPLYFWLPRAYSNASAPVAAIFSIMTKIGLYAIIRVYMLVFSQHTDTLNYFIWPVALITILLGSIGVAASKSLKELLSYLVIVSVGTLLMGVSSGNTESLVASLYYIIHSTWGLAGLFLLADLIARQRGVKTTELIQGPELQNPYILGSLFFLGAIMVIGLPPLSGFLGKLLLLKANMSGVHAVLFWSVLLLSSFILLVSFSRAGSTLFWRVSANQLGDSELNSGRLAACMGLLFTSIFLVVFAEPVLHYLTATVHQLEHVESYYKIILMGR